jgi:hypothetical protein
MKREEFASWVWRDILTQLFTATLLYMVPLIAYWSFVG